MLHVSPTARNSSYCFSVFSHHPLTPYLFHNVSAYNHIFPTSASLHPPSPHFSLTAHLTLLFLAPPPPPIHLHHSHPIQYLAFITHQICPQLLLPTSARQLPSLSPTPPSNPVLHSNHARPPFLLSLPHHRYHSLNLCLITVSRYASHATHTRLYVSVSTSLFLNCYVSPLSHLQFKRFSSQSSSSFFSFRGMWNWSECRLLDLCFSFFTG